MIERTRRLLFLSLVFIAFAASCGRASPQASAALVIETGSEVFLRIFKHESELELWSRAPGGETYNLQKTYPICAWSGALGPKLREGDGQAPEGFYSVRKSSLNPHSAYHLSFNLGYPNAYDRAHGRTGSYLMVHGNCVSIGCYAMTDEGIEEIYGAVETALENGQSAVPVHIFPFRMTDAAMAASVESRWVDFWTNLKTGHDLFEETSVPPQVTLDGLRYAFH